MAPDLLGDFFRAANQQRARWAILRIKACPTHRWPASFFANTGNRTITIQPIKPKHQRKTKSNVQGDRSMKQMNRQLFLLIALLSLFLSACQLIQPAAESAAPVGQMAAINGIQIYYEVHGSGPALILLHGGLGNAGYWQNQIPVFAKNYMVIAMDSRGHGRSTFNETQIGYAVMAADVLALMDYLKIDKADIVGWSDGGIIGIDLAIHHPERLNKVVAYGANYIPEGVNPDIGTNERFNAYIEQAAGDYQKLAADPTQWDAFLENIGQMWATEPNYTPEQLATITTPILVLDGEEEEAILTEHTIEMQGLIPGSELHLIPGTGHFAMWEKAEEFNQIILDYLAK